MKSRFFVLYLSHINRKNRNMEDLLLEIRNQQMLFDSTDFDDIVTLAENQPDFVDRALKNLESEFELDELSHMIRENLRALWTCVKGSLAIKEK